jgi:GT2 family glycosyltransferase
VWVLLPVHNRRQSTLTFVRHLTSQTYKYWHLLLLDDGSEDGSAEAVQELTSNVSVLRGNGGWWWAGALDYGYRWLKRHANGSDDIVLIINDDTEIEADFLANGVAHLQPRSLLLAQQYTVANRCLVEVGVDMDWKSFTHTTTLRPNAVNCQPTRGLFLRVEDLREIGGFHPTLLPHYQSDYEFTMRAARMGFDLISHPMVRLFYDEVQTGVHDLQNQDLLQRLRIGFSKRYKFNPIYLTSFVILSCPSRYKVLNVSRIWKSFFCNVVFPGLSSAARSRAASQRMGPPQAPRLPQPNPTAIAG